MKEAAVLGARWEVVVCLLVRFRGETGGRDGGRGVTASAVGEQDSTCLLCLVVVID